MGSCVLRKANTNFVASQICSAEFFAFGSLELLMVCMYVCATLYPSRNRPNVKELIDTCIAISDHVKSLGTGANCDNKLPNQLTRSFRKVCQMLLVVKILYVSSG